MTEGEFMLKRKIRSRESQLDLNIMNLEMEQRILFEFGILRILSSISREIILNGFGSKTNRGVDPEIFCSNSKSQSLEWD